jgi:autotransporter-associated beta strand protein
VSTTSDLVVNYTMAGTATEGVDYTGTTGSVTILAGATSAYVTIVPVNDTTAEGVESITMNLTPASGTYGLRTPSATLLLADNDAYASGSVGFASATSSIAEDVGTHPVVVNLTGTPSGTVAVNYRVSSGTATGIGYDYTLADGLLTFPPGTTTLNIPIPINPDTLPEPAETIVLQLYNAIGGNLSTSTHTVTINNRSLPEAFTDAASNLLANGATLNGHVLPNAVATDVWFQYGPTTSYGSTTTLQSIGSGTTSVSLSTAISGFAPGGYHYRCVAQSSLGTTYGIDQIISSNNASLAGLVTSVGAFSPTFDAAVLTYSVTVPNGTSTVTISPTVAQANATVKVNGTTVASGTPSAAIAVGSGTTTVNVVVTAQDGVTTRTYVLNIAPAGALTPQTITFAALPATTYGNAPFALTATASSGLPVSYSSSNPLVATVSGSTVTIVGAGSTNITATQSGNGTYEAAPPVIQSLVVNQVSQTISFGALATVLDDVALFTLNATASSGLTVSYASSNPAVATVSGNTVTVVSVGTTTITASQTGNTNYSVAASVPQALTVGRANPLAVVTGSPYVVLIGQSLTLNGSSSLASYGETLSTYEWDLNNDSVFGDATGATPAAISYAALTGTWGMVPGSNTIQLKVTDSASKTSTVSATVQILVSLTWDSNGTTAGQTNGAGTWLAANQWWDSAANQTWASGASAIFGGPSAAGGAVTLASPTSVNAITFNTFTGTYTLGTAGQTLTINGGIAKNSGSGIVSIISPVTLGAPQTWTNNTSSDLGATVALNNGGHTLTFGGPGPLSFSTVTSIISGAGGITMNGTGRLQLGAASVPVHTYSGTTTLNAGVTMMSSNNLGTGNLTMNGGVIESYWNTNFIRALGSGVGEVQLIGGASGFSLNGNTAMSVILGNNAANEAVWGSAVFNPSVLVLQTSASQAASSLNFQNKIDFNGADRTIQVSGGTTGAASATISGIIRSSSGTAGLIKTGSGLLILSAANTYNGDTTVSGGTLQIGNNTAGSLGNGTYNNSISLASGSILRIFSSSNQTLGGVISGGGGLVKSYAGTLTLASSNTYSGKTSLTPQTTAGAGMLSVSSFNSVVGGTACGWIGLTLGSLAGWWLGRTAGRRSIAALDDEARAALEARRRRLGPLVVVLTRPLPILAEAAALMAGATGMTWQAFLAAAAPANLAIAFAWSLAGALGRDADSLQWVAIAAVAVPAVVAALVAVRRHDAGRISVR